MVRLEALERRLLLATQLFPAAHVAVGDSPYDVLCADLNADGNLDVVTANREADTVSVLLGAGDGTFTSRSDYAAWEQPTGLAAADFDGDSDLDLAVSNQLGGQVSVLLNEGDGSFGSASHYAAQTYPTSVFAGDLNGDGAPDLAVSNRNSGSVSILLGNGDGTFQEQVAYALGSDPMKVVGGDLDLDGDVDLVVGNETGTTIHVLLNDGAGVFGSASPYTTGNWPRHVTLADVSGDGVLDVLVADEANQGISVLLGNGDGTLADHVWYEVGLYPRTVAVADMDGDGTVDILTTRETGDSPGVVVLPGNGDGTFGSSLLSAAGGRPRRVAAADMNGDGVMDVVAAHSTTNSVVVQLGYGDGTFPPRQFDIGEYARDLASADFNEDGILDLVAPNDRTDNVSLLLGNGDGTFADQLLVDVGVDPNGILAIDLNADGHVDLATANSNGFDVSVRLGVGNGAFLPMDSYDIAGYGVDILAADFDEDSVLDLAVANAMVNSVSIFLGEGDGTFAARADYAAGNGLTSMEAADVNGDGTLDLVVTGGYEAGVGGDSIAVLIGNGDGTFGAPVHHLTGDGPVSVRAADLNGDSLPDVATANESDNSVSVLLNTGVGFAAPVDYPVGLGTDPTPTSLTIEDLDGDGNWDIAVSNEQCFTVSVLLGNGDGTFQPPAEYATGQYPDGVIAGDFNGDGLPDLATADVGDRCVTVLIGTQQWRSEILLPRSSGQILAGDTLRFRGTGWAAESPVTYAWDFGDGRTSGLKNPGLITFLSAGEYDVTLAALNGGGVPDPNPDSVHISVVVDDASPRADLAVSDLDVPDDLAAGFPAGIAYTVTNTGDGDLPGGSWTDAVYLSEDAYLSTDDTFLGDRTATGALSAGATYDGVIDVTVPVVADGLYYLILSVDDEWTLLERHRLNNLSSEGVDFAIPWLVEGVPHDTAFTAVGRAQMYRVEVPVGGHLVIDLDDADDAGVNELFVLFGGPPTRGTYAQKSTHTGAADQKMLVQNPVPGTWYVMAFGGSLTGDNEYTISVNTTHLDLMTSEPHRHGGVTPPVLYLVGAGFDETLFVELVAGDGATRTADSVELDSVYEATIGFPGGGLDTGWYSLRIGLSDGQTIEWEDALEVVPIEDYIEAALRVDIVLPSEVGRHFLATVYVEYENIGTGALEAPLIRLDATDDGLMTLDSRLIETGVAGVWGSVAPEGFSDIVYILASGETPGLLMPGESRRVPVYWVGMELPWDFADFEVAFSARGMSPYNTALIDWASLSDYHRPEWVSEEAWDVVWANFQAQVGDTWGDFVRMLNENVAYLGRFGMATVDVSDLYSFEMRQADALNPLDYLASATDAYRTATGVPVVFARYFSQPISRRHEVGALGRGWFHNWEFSLTHEDYEQVTITDPTGTPRVFQLGRDDKYIGSPGDGAILERLYGTGFRLTLSDGSEMVFDTDGVPIRLTDRNGNDIVAGYTEGRLTSLTHDGGQSLTIEYNGAGLIEVVRDDLGRETTYVYDAANEHLMSVVYDDGRTVSYDYNLGGALAAEHALTEIEYPGGNHQYYSYDALGRLEECYQDGGAERFTFAYGDAGEVLVTDALGDTLAFSLGPSGELLCLENDAGNTVEWQFGPDHDLTALLDNSGRCVTFDYDANGRLWLVTDAAGEETIVDRLSFEHEGYRATVDANGVVTHVRYDEDGNLDSIIYADGTEESWGYYADGSMQSATNAHGEEVAYGFVDGLLDWYRYPDLSEVDYEYDTHGNLIELTDGSGTVILTYDSNDRLDTITWPDGRSLDYDWDAAGRRESLTDHLGQAVNYYYDAAGRLARLTDEGDAEIVQYTYDDAGRLAREDLANGVYTTYGYDEAGRVLHLVNYAPDDSVVSGYDYTYDAVGRRETVTSLDGTWTYAYDLADRLIGATFDSTDLGLDDQDITYVYDAVGNRTQTIVNGATTVYVPDDMNQYTEVGTYTYTYDDDGNLTLVTDGVTTTTYAYDELNRLVEVVGPDGTETYSYDALGYLAGVTTGGDTVYYMVDPFGMGDVVGVFDDVGDLLSHYDYGLGLVAGTDAVGDTAYFTYDALGSTSELTDAGGSVLNSYAYLPFGRTVLADESVDNPFLFVGREGVMEQSNGLYAMRSRFYEPETGRFLSRDPLRFAGGDTNFYTYAGNDPINRIDPEGQRWTCGETQGDTSSGSFGVSWGWSEGISYGLAASVGFGAGVGVGPGATLGPAANLGVADAGAGFQAGIQAQVFAGWSYGGSLGWSYGKTDGWFCGWTSDEEEEPAPRDEDDDGGDDDEDDQRWDLGPGPGAAGGGGGGGGGGAGGGNWGGGSDTVDAVDPNEKLGPAGFGDDAFVRPGSLLSYRVDFENDPAATAPAHQVTVTDQLDSDLDWATFELTEVGFGSRVITVPGGNQYYETVVPMSYNGKDLEVHISAGIDPETGQFAATFDSIDPLTGWPTDALTGFLPPEDGSGRGQGYVAYVVYADPGLPTGTEIRNIAQITFDFGETIATNQVDPHDPGQGTDPAKECLTTIDAGAPASYVLALSPTVTSASFDVEWTGADDPGGSGIVAYDVWVSTDGGPYAVWLAHTAATSATFDGVAGHTYSFYSVATDGVAHVELAPGSADTSTTVLSNAPPEVTLDDPSGDMAEVGALHIVSWTDSDPDDDALIDLYWDLDTNPANNDPADEGTTWGTIAVGISEDDAADSYNWLVDAPPIGSVYLRATIDDGLASDEDYSPGTLDVASVRHRSGSVVVSFYEMDSGGSLTPADVDVRLGAANTVKSIKLRGYESMEGLGIVISGASSVGSIKDSRKGVLGDVAFIASNAYVKSVKLKSDLVGYDLNGLSLGGLTFDADIDGDGNEDDATGLYVEGGVGTVKVYGDVTGDVWVQGSYGGYSVKSFETKSGGGFHADLAASGYVRQIKLDGSFGSSIDIGGDLSKLQIKSGSFGGELTVGGDLSKLDVRGPILTGSTIDVGGDVGKLSAAGDVDARITVDGYLSKMQIKGGDLLTDMHVGGGIGTVDVKASKYGGGSILTGSSLLVDAGVSKLKVRGDLEGSEITVAGLLNKMDVYGDYHDSNVLAGALGKVKVKGDIASTDPTDDLIHALTGSFYLYEGKTRHEILDAVGVWLDGVHAYVG